jgi:hypothetical protein
MTKKISHLRMYIFSILIFAIIEEIASGVLVQGKLATG